MVFEIFTKKGWLLSDLNQMEVADVFRVRGVPAENVQCAPGQLYVIVAPPFEDVDGEWNAAATEYPQGTNIH